MTFGEALSLNGMLGCDGLVISPREDRIERDTCRVALRGWPKLLSSCVTRLVETPDEFRYGVGLRARRSCDGPRGAIHEPDKLRLRRDYRDRDLGRDTKLERKERSRPE